MDIKHKVELSKRGSTDFDTRPDRVELTFDDDLIRSISVARAVLSLDMLGEGADITLSLADDGQFLVDDGGGTEVEYFDDEERLTFQVSSGWLRVDARSLSLAYWERYADDELQGQIDLTSDCPQLRDAIESAMPTAFAELRQRLAAKVL